MVRRCGVRRYKNEISKNRVGYPCRKVKVKLSGVWWVEQLFPEI